MLRLRVMGGPATTMISLATGSKNFEDRWSVQRANSEQSSAPATSFSTDRSDAYRVEEDAIRKK
jgi:hypothetical protein